MNLPVSRKPYCPADLRSAIVRFTRDFSQARKKFKLEDPQDWLDVVKKIAKKWSLRMREHDGASAVFFVSNKHGFVVKRSYLCSRGHKLPKCAIYTKALPFRTPNDDFIDGPVYVQPLADVSDDVRYDACDAIERSRIKVTDLHSGNVAVFHGKAVAIDW